MTNSVLNIFILFYFFLNLAEEYILIFGRFYLENVYITFYHDEKLNSVLKKTWLLLQKEKNKTSSEQSVNAAVRLACESWYQPS